MPLSPAQTKLNHRIGYLYPTAYMVGGLAVLGMPLFIDGPKDFEGMIVMLLIGLGLIAWGAIFVLASQSIEPNDANTHY